MKKRCTFFHFCTGKEIFRDIVEAKSGDYCEEVSGNHHKNNGHPKVICQLFERPYLFWND